MEDSKQNPASTSMKKDRAKQEGIKGKRKPEDVTRWEGEGGAIVSTGTFPAVHPTPPSSEGESPASKRE